MIIRWLSDTLFRVQMSRQSNIIDYWRDQFKFGSDPEGTWSLLSSNYLVCMLNQLQLTLGLQIWSNIERRVARAMQVLANIISSKNLVSFKFLLFYIFTWNIIAGFYQNYKMLVSFKHLKFEVAYIWHLSSEYQMKKGIHIKACTVKWNSKSNNYILHFD